MHKNPHFNQVVLQTEEFSLIACYVSLEAGGREAWSFDFWIRFFLQAHAPGPLPALCSCHPPAGLSPALPCRTLPPSGHSWAASFSDTIRGPLPTTLLHSPFRRAKLFPTLGLLASSPQTWGFVGELSLSHFAMRVTGT